MKYSFKKFIALLLTIVMVWSSLPLDAMAARMTVNTENVSPTIGLQDLMKKQDEEAEEEEPQAEEAEEAEGEELQPEEAEEEQLPAEDEPVNSYDEGNGNQGSYTGSDNGRYASVTVSGSYKAKKDKPELTRAAVAAPAGYAVLDAWTVSFQDKHTALSVIITAEDVPELQEGESLSFYALQDGVLAQELMDNVDIGNSWTFAPALDGVNGVALVKMGGSEAEPATLDEADQGDYTTVTLSGTYNAATEKPALERISVAAPEGLTVLEAWTVSFQDENAALSLLARLDTLPELAQGEALSFYAVNGNTLGAELLPDLELGNEWTVTPALNGVTGIALVKLSAAVAAELVDDGALYSNQDLYITGKLPAKGIIDVTPVSVSVEGQDALIAYDINIYVNENQKAKGKTWQPAGDKVTVHLRDAALVGLDQVNVYHLPAGGGAELVGTVAPAGDSISFDAYSFSTYAVLTLTHYEGSSSSTELRTWEFPDDNSAISLNTVMDALGIHANVFDLVSDDETLIQVTPPMVSQKAKVVNNVTQRDKDGAVILEDCTPTPLRNMDKKEYPPTTGSQWTIQRGSAALDPNAQGTATLTLTLFDRPTYLIEVSMGGENLEHKIILRHVDGSEGSSFRISEMVEVYVTGYTAAEMAEFNYSYAVSNQVNNGTLQCFNAEQRAGGNDATAIGIGGKGRRWFAMERPENYQTASATVTVTVKNGNTTIDQKSFNMTFDQSSLQSDLNDLARSIHPIVLHVGDTVNLKELLSKAGLAHPNCNFTHIKLDNSMTLVPTETDGEFKAENSGEETILVTVDKTGCYYHSGRGGLYDNQVGTFYLDVYVLEKAGASVDEDTNDLTLTDLNPYSSYVLGDEDGHPLTDENGNPITFGTSTVTFKDLNDNTNYTVSVRKAEIPEITSPDTTYQMRNLKTSLEIKILDPNYEYRLSRANDDKTPWMRPDASGSITFTGLTPGVNNYQLLKIDRVLTSTNEGTIQPNYPKNNTADGYTRYRANLDSSKEWRITSLDGSTVYVDWTKGGGNNTTLGAAGTLTKNQNYLLWSRSYVTQETVQTRVSSPAAAIRVLVYPGRVYKVEKGTATGTPVCDGIDMGDGWYAPADGSNYLTFTGMAGGNLTTYILKTKQAGQPASDVEGTTDVTTGDGAALPSENSNPEIVGVTATTVTVKAEPGYEYSIDGGKTWVNATQATFDDLPGGKYTIEEVVTQINFIDDKAAEPTTITTHGTMTVNRYAVAFDANGGEGSMENETFDIGKAKALISNAFTRECYDFAGWNTAANGSGTSYADEASVKDLSTTPGATVTLYAQWTGYPYTVHFDANRGTGGMADQNFVYGTAQNLTANTFTRPVSTFLGWDENKDATAPTYTDGQSVSNLTTEKNGTVTLYAIWQVNGVTINYVAGEHGSVSKANDDVAWATESVTGATATPDSHYHFVN